MSVGGSVELCARAAEDAPTRSTVSGTAATRRRKRQERGWVISVLLLPGIVPAVGDMSVTKTKRFREVRNIQEIAGLVWSVSRRCHRRGTCSSKLGAQIGRAHV